MVTINKRIALGAAAALGFMLASAPAYAQATRTWISGVGDDANPCSRTAPCKTFAGAISKTAAGGEINCIDSAGFGAVTITKSISILCDEVENGVLVSSGNGITINNTTANVVLSGFDLEGFGNGGGSSNHGINIVNAASVEIRNTRIHAFKGYGINVAPQAGSTRLLIDNVVITDAGTAGNPASGGVAIMPAAGMTVTGTINNLVVSNSVNAGIKLDTTGIAGSVIAVRIQNSTIDNNVAIGMLVKAPAATGTIRLTVNNSSFSQNGTIGVFGNGSGVTGYFDAATINGNATGVSIANGAVLNSYGNNKVNANTTADGAFSSPVTPTK